MITIRALEVLAAIIAVGAPVGVLLRVTRPGRRPATQYTARHALPRRRQAAARMHRTGCRIRAVPHAVAHLIPLPHLTFRRAA